MEKLPFEEIQREILVKKESASSEKYGKRPEERTIKELLESSVICLNKVSGPSSHNVADYAKKALKVEKVGHGGTLDPVVTGVLPLSIGRATKVMEALLKAGKEYICLMHIHKPISQSKIHKSSKDFIGKITQLPPVKSAVKRQLREREIYYLEILEIKNQDVLFRVGCQAGTYIRKLCLSPETEVITKNGIKTIEELWKTKEELEVFSFRDNKLKINKICDFQKIPFNGKLIEIKTYSGIKIRVTLDHKLLVSKENSPAMMEAEKMKEGEFLFRTTIIPNIRKNLLVADLLDDEYLVHKESIKKYCKIKLIEKYGSIREFYRKTKIDRKPFIGKYKIDIKIKHLKMAGIFEQVKNKLNCFKTEKGTIIKIKPELTEELLYLIGLIASDGNNTKEAKTIRHTRILFSNTNKEIIRIFSESIRKIFPSARISIKIKGNQWHIATSNSLLATLCANLGVKSPFKENDILQILHLKNKLIKSFLRGYLDGDGYISKNIKKTEIIFSCINYNNIKRIHEMLLKLGIQNRIAKRKIYDKNSKSYKDYYDAKLIDPASKLEFCQSIGSDHPLKKERLKKIEEYFKELKREPEGYLYEPIDRKIYLSKLKKLKIILGGNYYKMVEKGRPMTKYVYKILRLLDNKIPKMSEFTAEEIVSIKKIQFNGYVYNITVKKDHNFLIENGIVSGNCTDWGKALETNAHMAELIRTKAGPFNEKEWHSLQDIKDAFTLYEEGNEEKLKKILKPVEFAVQHLPKIWIIDSAVDTLCHGANLSIPGISKLETKIEKENLVAIMTLKNELIAIGTSIMTSDEIIKNQKGLAIKTSKVFMEPEIYPHFRRNSA